MATRPKKPTPKRKVTVPKPKKYVEYIIVMGHGRCWPVNYFRDGPFTSKAAAIECWWRKYAHRDDAAAFSIVRVTCERVTTPN